MIPEWKLFAEQYPPSGVITTRFKIMLYTPKAGARIGYYDSDSGRWIVNGNSVKPTHWDYLPEKPK
jgi:hypothetical protein